MRQKLEINPFVCTICHTGYHQVLCTGIVNRYERMRKKKSWICPTCDESTSAQPLPTQPTNPSAPNNPPYQPTPPIPSIPCAVEPQATCQSPSPNCVICKKSWYRAGLHAMAVGRLAIRKKSAPNFLLVTQGRMLKRRVTCIAPNA